jgi:two-component system OmpR family response regulator
MTVPALLVVDDDAEIRDLLARYLGEHSFEVLKAADGAEMRQRLAAARVDLLILDLMLPGEDGLALCRWLRAQPETAHLPILMLTARGDRLERVVGLELGADDYVTKPFDPRELVARIRAILRRSRAALPAEAPATGYRFEGWFLDSVERRLMNPAGHDVELSPGEFDLLLTFVENPRRVMDREQLLDRTRGRSLTPYDRSVDVQVSRLRRKLEQGGGGTDRLIRTVRGAGYIFSARVTRQ